MNSKKTLLAALLAALMLTSGCGSSASQQQTDTAAQTGETGASNVASASDMAEVEEVVEEGMTPISGDKVKDGTYSVAVKSSSKMFDITACELTVESGKMTATMHMGGKGYLYVYMGTGEQAAAADEADYIPFTEQADGTHSFTVPVDALDEGIDCAAFSKKKEKWYDRHILTLKTLYHRFSENKNIILIVFIINVFVWVIVNINIIEYGNLSSEYLWKYPYNYVCMTEEKYTDEIHKVIKEPDEKIDEYAYIPLISNDGGEYVGISEDSYNKLTKNKKEHIKQGEVKAVLEKSKQDDENMFQDKHVYLKTATGMCKFAIKKEVKEVLFVAQQSDIIRILVMNNSDFDMLRSLQKKNTVIMTQQTEKETVIDEGKLKVCEKKYEIIGFYKGSLMKEDRSDDLTTLIFYICIGAFLIISGIMILSIKIWSDISNVSMKYEFLKKIGMEIKEIKKNVKKELSLSLWIAFILSIVISGGALSYITWNVDWLLKKQVLITFFALLLFQAGYIILLREYGWRLANQQIQSERREKIWK